MIKASVGLRSVSMWRSDILRVMLLFDKNWRSERIQEGVRYEMESVGCSSR